MMHNHFVGFLMLRVMYRADNNFMKYDTAYTICIHNNPVPS